ncbi:hypothetical protein D7T58_16345 [Stenotrophomonas maltophilia]|nr:hypothetical protein [Stenotrophomonas maltophilia]MBA0470259.1 hypothetical protein [Stenotrophomonas maltophilia]MBA0477870.1 hypothetical protein [Stenotrophomonas maltophilia]MBA0486185.1 hypothetical protein [Stenotrophomonas maltophilia]
MSCCAATANRPRGGRVDCQSTALRTTNERPRASRDSRLTVDSTPRGGAARSRCAWRPAAGCR